MRLIQQRPAWSLHIYMRFIGMEYISENSPSKSALGRMLPIIVDDTSIKHEREALEMLQLIKNSSLASSQTSRHDILVDTIVSNYLRSTILATYSQLIRLYGKQKDNYKKFSPIGLGFIYSGILDMQNFFNFERLEPYPLATETELLDILNYNYKLIDELIQGNEDHPLSFIFRINTELDESNVNMSSVMNSSSLLSSNFRGISDALLFEHIADAICNENLCPIVSKYQYLLAYFSNMCSLYFASHYKKPSDSSDCEHVSWREATDSILNNSFLQSSSCEKLKNLLVETEDSLISFDRKRYNKQVSFSSAMESDTVDVIIDNSPYRNHNTSREENINNFSVDLSITDIYNENIEDTNNNNNNNNNNNSNNNKTPIQNKQKKLMEIISKNIIYNVDITKQKYLTVYDSPTYFSKLTIQSYKSIINKYLTNRKLRNSESLLSENDIIPLPIIDNNNNNELINAETEVSIGGIIYISFVLSCFIGYLYKINN